jgi:hypothetical protein
MKEKGNLKRKGKRKKGKSNGEQEKQKPQRHR